jgi:chromosome segregation ATPase
MEARSLQADKALGLSRAEGESLVSQLSARSASLASKSERVNDLEKQIGSLIAAQDRLNKSLQEEEGRAAAAVERIRTLEESQGDLVQNSSRTLTAEADASAFQLQLAALELEVEQKAADLSQASASIDTFRTEIASLQAANDAKQQRLSAAEKLVASISNEKFRIKAELNETNAELAALVSLSQKADQDTGSGTAKAAPSGGEQTTISVSGLEQQITHFKSQISVLTDKLTTSEKKSAAAEKLISAISVEKLKLKAELVGASRHSYSIAAACTKTCCIIPCANITPISVEMCGAQQYSLLAHVRWLLGMTQWLLAHAMVVGT